MRDASLLCFRFSNQLEIMGNEESGSSDGADTLLALLRDGDVRDEEEEVNEAL